MADNRRRVWKYPLSYRGIQKVELPAGARFLLFAVQNGVPTLWYEVMPLTPTTTRDFRIIGTGLAIPLDAEWLGACLDGPHVWHLYMLAKGEDGG